MSHPALALGVNVLDGHITYPGVAKAFNLPCAPLERVLSVETV